MAEQAAVGGTSEAPDAPDTPAATTGPSLRDASAPTSPGSPRPPASHSGGEGPAGATDGLADPGDRGSLDVASKAIRRIAERAALDVPGVVRHRTTVGRLTGASTPSASLTFQGRSARIALDVSAVWPCPITAIGARVRDAVRERTAALSGMHVASVDVTVHVISPDDQDPSTRRRVA